LLGHGKTPQAVMFRADLALVVRVGKYVRLFSECFLSVQGAEKRVSTTLRNTMQLHRLQKIAVAAETDRTNQVMR
jgi:hypothetical protein